MNEEILKQLDAKIPRSAISKREAGGGVKLDYLSGWYVIDRLNKVIGHLNWAYDANEKLVHVGQIEDRYGKTVHTVHYIAKVRLQITVGTVQTEFNDFGYGDGSDKVNVGKAHELAIKEAVTDGIKRCAKNIGMSFGLALYDKAQENVEDEPAAEPAAPTVRELRIAELKVLAGSLMKKNKVSNVQLQEMVKREGFTKSDDLSLDAAGRLLQNLKQLALG